MKVYGHPLSSCTRKVLVALAEKGATADFVAVDLFAGEHKTAGHMARHPFGVVPVLVEDGLADPLEGGDFTLYESRAILRYLEARFPANPLVPAGVRERARMDQWLSVDQSYVGPHTRALAIERIVKKHEGLPPDRAVERATEGALGAALRVIDGALRVSPYLAGDSFSLADVSLMPYVASLPMIGAEHLRGDLPSLGAWWSRVSARPSWRSVVGPA